MNVYIVIEHEWYGPGDHYEEIDMVFKNQIDADNHCAVMNTQFSTSERAGFSVRSYNVTEVSSSAPF
jgi:hypothetical protein